MAEETLSLSPSQLAQREVIIEASRELFSRFGYKKTTMDDIAGTMRKGKSSLYYYFKNKEDIFTAVIMLESNILHETLKEIIDSDLSATEKLKKYIFKRIETITQLQNYQNVLKEGIYGGYEFLEGFNDDSENVDCELLESILEEGVRAEEFDIKNIRWSAIAISTSLRGLEIPIFRGSLDFENIEEQLENVVKVLFYGITKR